jgi:hypothetical protein
MSMVPMIKPDVDTQALEAAKGKATEAGQAIRDLDMMVSPQVNTASLDSAISKGRTLIAILWEAGGLANAGAHEVTRTLYSHT